MIFMRPRRDVGKRDQARGRHDARLPPMPFDRQDTMAPAFATHALAPMPHTCAVTAP